MLDCTRGLFHYGILCWHKSIFLAIGFIVFFGTIEALYFLASLIKFKEGAWVPIVLAFFFMMVMCIWHYGTIKKYEVDLQNKVSNLPAFHQVITVSQDLQLQLQQFQEYARNGVPAQTLTASAVGLRQQDRPPPLHQGLPPPLLELQRRQSARGRRREGWEVASPPAWACELHRVARRLQPARGAGLRRHQAARGEGLRRRRGCEGCGAPPAPGCEARRAPPASGCEARRAPPASRLRGARDSAGAKLRGARDSAGAKLRGAWISGGGAEFRRHRGCAGAEFRRCRAARSAGGSPPLPGSKFPDSIVMMVGDGSSNQQPHPNGFNWAGGAVESALPVTGLNPAAQRYVLPEFGFGRLDSAGS
nr:uncharacterized protein LOC127347594 [Lolium perenne]